jgi:hypothetical protein
MITYTERQVVNFFRKFDRPEEGCWEWKKAVAKTGYGQFGIPTLGWGGLAHRFSYLYYFGDLPDGLMVCHKCDNRMCVRPDHLFLGTNKDNMDDRKNKGLGRVVGEKGELHTLAKLTDELVAWARLEYNRGRTGKEIAEELGISSATISRALKGITWSHVPGAISEDMYQRGDRHHHKGGRPKS